MKKAFNILLVDDSKTTNFYNKKIITSFDCVKEIYEAYNGLEALNLLKEKKIKLDLILLDINMPIMDGFEFLKEYEKLSLNIRTSIEIAILTTSTWTRDREKAEHNKHLISGYFEKPLRKKTIEALLFKN